MGGEDVVSLFIYLSEYDDGREKERGFGLLTLMEP